MGSNPIGPTNSAGPATGILADNHVHSQWSYDTGPDASMAAACAHAVALGLPSVAFTEHLDFREPGPDDPLTAAGAERHDAGGIRPLDVPGYLAAVAECRDRFPALRILSGVEAGEPHLFAASAAAMVGSGRLDRVLGSVHGVRIGAQLVYSGWLLRRDPPAEVMRRYFAEVVAMIEGSGLFEVLAHLDFPRRYWPASAGAYTEAAFEEEYRAVLRALATSGRVLEINTASPLLSASVLRWWAEEGGVAVSFGSDAHVPWHVGARFQEASGIAADAGFRPGPDPLDFWRR